MTVSDQLSLTQGQRIIGNLNTKAIRKYSKYSMLRGCLIL